MKIMLARRLPTRGGALLIAALLTAVVGFAAPAAASVPYAYVFHNFATGRCLDDSTAFGNDVLRGYSCNDFDYQRWGTFGGPGGSYTIRNKETGRCLDDSTAFGNDVLRGYDCNGSNYQKWG
jgi:hypothetical protein